MELIKNDCVYLQVSMITRARHITNSFLEHKLHCIKSAMNLILEECSRQRAIYFLSLEAFHYANMNFRLFSFYVVKYAWYFWIDYTPVVVAEFRVVVVHSEAALAVVENIVYMAEKNKRRGENRSEVVVLDRLISRIFPDSNRVLVNRCVC